MKTTIIVGIVLLLMLVWVALHDIIKGGENLTNEYIVVIISAVSLPLLIYSLFRKISRAHK